MRFSDKSKDGVRHNISNVRCTSIAQLNLLMVNGYVTGIDIKYLTSPKHESVWTHSHYDEILSIEKNVSSTLLTHQSRCWYYPFNEMFNLSVWPLDLSKSKPVCLLIASAFEMRLSEAATEEPGQSTRTSAQFAAQQQQQTHSL